MINYTEALSALFQHAKRLPIETINILDALGFVAAETVVSPYMLPHFMNSAMDGFAVKASHTNKASPAHPVYLDIQGEIAAGDIQKSCNDHTGAWEIMTGAPVPSGYDAVIRLEDVTKDSGRIMVTKPAAIKDNVRAPGEDINTGDIIIKEGERLLPEHITTMAAAGITAIKTFKKPTIALLCTGKELVDDATVPLHGAQIRNSNAPFLQSFLSLLGFDVHYFGVVPDDPDHFFTTYEKIMTIKPDVILSTGAVSVGNYDFIPESLKALGADIIFHKAQIRPGKPILFARFPQGPYFFGLPGNPVAAAVGMRFFVYPLLRQIQGLKAEQPLCAKLSHDAYKKTDFRCFQKAIVSNTSQGELHVEILKNQESFKIFPLLKANCWAVLRENQKHFKAHDIIDVFPFYPPHKPWES